MFYTFDLLCCCCQKLTTFTFRVEPQISDDDHKFQCECGHVLCIDDEELVFTAETLKATEIMF